MQTGQRARFNELAKFIGIFPGTLELAMGDLHQALFGYRDNRFANGEVVNLPPAVLGIALKLLQPLAEAAQNNQAVYFNDHEGNRKELQWTQAFSEHLPDGRALETIEVSREQFDNFQNFIKTLEGMGVMKPGLGGAEQFDLVILAANRVVKQTQKCKQFPYVLSTDHIISTPLWSPVLQNSLKGTGTRVEHPPSGTIRIQGLPEGSPGENMIQAAPTRRRA